MAPWLPKWWHIVVKIHNYLKRYNWKNLLKYGHLLVLKSGGAEQINLIRPDWPFGDFFGAMRLWECDESRLSVHETPKHWDFETMGAKKLVVQMHHLHQLNGRPWSYRHVCAAVICSLYLMMSTYVHILQPHSDYYTSRLRSLD